MIDYFNSIFTAVAKELRKQVPGIFVTGEINDSNVKKFPCVQIEENSNLPVHIDSAGYSKPKQVRCCFPACACLLQ